MGKSKRLPNDIVLAALQLVRGQARRKAEYNRQVDEIILRSGTNFVDNTLITVDIILFHFIHNYSQKAILIIDIKLR